ncbi:MAG TPA: hypothetical protein DDW41_05320, partial [Candidatus Andersenbacteria bacterium]|nr:hypothetical protein [Candidatus Andersenbacteria bacterium]
MSNVISIKTIKIGLGVLVVTALLAFVGWAAVANASFDRSLKQGMTGDDVMELQEFLNTDVDTMVASTGVGSAGSESKYFGSLTKAAVVKFQNKYASEVLTPIGLTSGTGYFGTMSRAKADALVAGGTTSTTPGCETGDLFSRTTGTACVTTTPPVTTLPAGCTSTTGFSTTTGASCATGVVPGAAGTVALSADNPASGVIIETQSAADLLHLTFSGTYTVTNLKLNRLGISTGSTLSNVYLFDGATRLTDAASINSEGEISWNQPSGLFTVAGSRIISVRGNVADSTSGQTIGFALKEAMAGTTAITGTASGNLFSVASNPSTMSTAAFGTVSPSNTTINPGAAVTLWRSQVTTGNNNIYLDRIAFRQVGSATATAFANFKLYVGGVEVATATGLDSNNYVTFVPTTPLLITTSKEFRVDVDVVSGASRTVQLSLRTAADVGLRDSQLGVSIVATGIPAVATTANTISGTSGGTMTIEKDVTSPSTNLTLNGADVNLGTFKATAYGESIKIETLTVGGTFNGTLGSTSDAAVTLRNGRIMIGGTQYGSTSTLVPAGTAFTLNYTVVPGTPVLMEVHADVYDNDGTGVLDAADTLLATVIAGSSNAQRVDSLGTLSVPGTAVSANTLVVA